MSLAVVAAAAGTSAGELSRIERALAPWVSVIALFRLGAVLGLDLSVRLYEGGPPVRDAPQISILLDFSSDLHASLRWDTEVPLPIAGDPRAWDGMVRGVDWRFGVEAESSPRDAQALVRRLQLKQRDGAVDGVILLVRDTRQTRQFLESGAPELDGHLPHRTHAMLAALRRGARPPGNGIVVVARRRPPTRIG